jgi:hypothetical protein
MVVPYDRLNNRPVKYFILLIIMILTDFSADKYLNEQFSRCFKTKKIWHIIEVVTQNI